MQRMVHVCSPILARGGGRAEPHAHQPSDQSRAPHAGPGGHSRMRGRAGLGTGSDGQARLWRPRWGLRGSLQQGHSHALTMLLWQSSKVLELPLPPAAMEQRWEAAGDQSANPLSPAGKAQGAWHVSALPCSQGCGAARPQPGNTQWSARFRTATRWWWISLPSLAVLEMRKCRNVSGAVSSLKITFSAVCNPCSAPYVEGFVWNVPGRKWKTLRCTGTIMLSCMNAVLST